MSLEVRHMTVAGSTEEGAPIVVLLHGFGGGPEDLAPFASSMGLGARFVFPAGPVDLGAGAGAVVGGSPPPPARAWWPIDVDARDAAMARGEERDLSGLDPDGLPAARDALVALLDDVERELGPAPLIVGGFSQGAMLACDVVLRTGRKVAGVVILSGARICASEWNPRLAAHGRDRASASGPGQGGLPVFVSHGRRDAHLSFAAADAFQRDLAAAGWRVTWRPFDGGHEIPLVVLRALKKFLRETFEATRLTTAP
jgi:phospholipase/carboxylesterase